MWVYHQSTGILSHNNKVIARGYSGNGTSLKEGRNNPAMESIEAKGPIPKGRWKIGAPYDSKSVGPYALILNPVNHNAYGRTAFRIHGDNKINNASHGCIIMPRAIREMIWTSGDHDLTVVE